MFFSCLPVLGDKTGSLAVVLAQVLCDQATLCDDNWLREALWLERYDWRLAEAVDLLQFWWRELGFRVAVEDFNLIWCSKSLEEPDNALGAGRLKPKITLVRRLLRQEAWDEPVDGNLWQVALDLAWSKWGCSCSWCWCCVRHYCFWYLSFCVFVLMEYEQVLKCNYLSYGTSEINMRSEKEAATAENTLSGRDDEIRMQSNTNCHKNANAVASLLAPSRNI